jgi:hypothetical protein
MDLDLPKLLKDLSVDGPAKHAAKLTLQTAAAAAAKAGTAATLAKALAELLAASVRPARNVPRTGRNDSAGRRELLAYLGELAGPDEIPALQKCTEDFEIRDAARAALERVPGDAATAALAKLAQGADGTDLRIGAINALAKRAGNVAVDALRACCADADARIRGAAAAALSRFAEPGLDAVIVAACDAAKGVAAHVEANCLRLRLAANVAKAGHKAEAERIFKAVAAGPHDECCKKAVKAGLEALAK